MNSSSDQSTTDLPRKMRTADISARMIVFVCLLSLPFLAAGTLAWPQGLLYLGLVIFLTGGSRVLMAHKYPDLVQERLHAAERADSKQWDKPLSTIIGL